MPLPILTNREWDDGFYDQWHYDAKTFGPLTPIGAKGGVVTMVGDRRPNSKAGVKKL